MMSPNISQDPSNGALRISILHVPDCPQVPRLAAEVQAALRHLGTTAVVEEIEGPYRSPTLLVNGIEIDGYPAGSDPACRIDIPTRKEIAAAMVAVRAVRTRPGDRGSSR